MKAPTFYEPLTSTRLVLLTVDQPETEFISAISGERTSGPMYGYMWLAVSMPRNEETLPNAVEILSTSLTGPGVSDGSRFTRRFSLTGRGAGPVPFEPESSESVELEFSAEYLDDLAVATRPARLLRESVPGLFETPRDIYKGRLTVAMQLGKQEDGAPSLQVRGRLTFELQESGSKEDSPRFQQLVAELPQQPILWFPDSVAMPWFDLDEGYGQHEQRPAAPFFMPLMAPAQAAAGSSDKPRGVLRLKPVRFNRMVTRSGVETGRSIQVQCDNAIRLWAGSCLDIQVLPEKLVDESDLQESEVALVDSTDPAVVAGLWSNPDLFSVTVFFAPGSFAGCGGGATWNANTNIPTIVLTDLDPTDPDHNNLNLLAHELGHVLLSLHPVSPPLSGYWKPDSDTVMEATNDSSVPNPDSNTDRNRRLANGPVVYPDGSSCTPT